MNYAIYAVKIFPPLFLSRYAIRKFTDVVKHGGEITLFSFVVF
jgi:hypothetical protein